MPVSLPSASTTARTFRLCNRVRCTMLSASCSIDRPDLTRRTLDWLSTSLLKGISREGLSLIFWTALAMSDSPRRAAERLSPDLLPVTDKPARLSLSDAQHQLRSIRAQRADPSCSFLAAPNDGIDRGRQKAEQEIGGLRCRARRTDDGAIILAQHLQPGTDVVSVAHGRHDTERGTNEGTCHFGDQLFARV